MGLTHTDTHTHRPELFLGTHGTVVRRQLVDDEVSALVLVVPAGPAGRTEVVACTACY